VDPVAALNEIATLLERERASRYRSKAFRSAADAAASLPEEVLRDPARLRRVKGIGDSSLAVIGQAVAGQVPDYLAELRARYDVPAAGKLRAALRGDLHAHSDWSDGLASIDLMVQAARDLGHEYLALTDHSPRLRVANGLSPERLREQLRVVAGMSGGGFTLLSGIEVDILDDGALDQDAELLDQLDVVVASVHSKLRMPRAEMTERMLTAVANPHVDVLGHFTGRMVTGRRKRPESEFDADRVFAACVEHGVAVEVNSRPERLDPPKRLLRLAVEAGCDFTIDTDAHAPGQLDWLGNGCERAVACAVPPDRVLNTWPVEKLLDRTRA
jgi:putative hydrolase